MLIRPKIFGSTRKHVLSWLVPLGVGAILVSPFLYQAARTYLTSNATFNGEIDIQRAILSTGILPIEIIAPLFAILALFFLLSKEYKGRLLYTPSITVFHVAFNPLSVNPRLPLWPLSSITTDSYTSCSYLS